jgi:hypothetical protein
MVRALKRAVAVVAAARLSLGLSGTPPVSGLLLGLASGVP